MHEQFARKGEHTTLKIVRPIKLVCWNQSMTKEARIYDEEKIVSSRSGAGETGKLHTKEWD